MDPLLGAIPGAVHHDIAGVQADIVAAPMAASSG